MCYSIYFLNDLISQITVLMPTSHVDDGCIANSCLMGSHLSLGKMIQKKRYFGFQKSVGIWLSGMMYKYKI